MNRLQTELHRLYLPPRQEQRDANAATCGPGHADGQVRAMVLELARPADWKALSPLWRGVQTDLELPAPAIAVNGIDGFQLWFSLAVPVTVAQALAFLEALRGRYLGNIAAERIGMTPVVEAPGTPQAGPGTDTPARRETSGHWSAFVLPDLAAVFCDDPWLDLPPNPDAQADLLSRLESASPAAFQRAQDRLGPSLREAAQATASAPAVAAGGTTARRPAEMAPAGHHQTPKAFLLAVMNDPAIDLQWRIEAAKALLPCA